MFKVFQPYAHLFSPKAMGHSRHPIALRGPLSVKISAACILCTLVLLPLIYSIEDIRKLTTYYGASILPPLPDDARPPVYKEIRRLEMNLPQHNPYLPYPEGKWGRYVLFSNSRVHLSGWNNKLNDMLMNTWLAYASNRAYVFHDFAWVDSHYPWPVSSYREWAPRTPLNALISGPSAGASWDEGDSAPRAVSETYFDIVCPKHERKIINTRDVKPFLRDADGKVIFEHWRTLLANTKERCVEVVAAPRHEDPFPETFDISYWSCARSLSLWSTFVQSPVSRLLGTSTIVQSVIEGNIGLFLSPSLQTSSFENTRYPYDVPNLFSSVFSIHVRRGDFKQACAEHAAMNSTFYNWNLLPFLPDKLATHPTRQENERRILERCWPTREYIRERVNQARRTYESQVSLVDGRGLSALYIMSNDRTEWIEELKRAFERDGWSRVVMSRDLKLNPQQKDVSVAVDMEIGIRSGVFIGNGWSSFTSNVVHRRLADGKAPISIRFW